MKNNLIKFLSCFIFWSSQTRRHFRKKMKARLFSPFDKDNTLILVTADGEKQVKRYYSKKIRIEVSGVNNVIKIPENAPFKSSKIIIKGDNNHIEIRETNSRIRFDIYSQNVNNTSLIIGKDVSSVDTKIHLCEDNAKLIIGNDCMFSYRVEIWASDAHSIIDKDSKKILNKVSKPLVIGNHCWLGCGVMLTKNACLANYTIVGAGSVVTKPFSQEYIAIAGNPAKIVKENVNWARCKTSDYVEDDI